MPDSRPASTDLVYVVFSDDWGRHPSSCQHLFARILPHAQVIWVNTVGLRTPRLSLYDLRRAGQVIFSWLRPARGSEGKREDNRDAKAAPGVPLATPTPAAPAPIVLRPLMWPSFRRRWIASVNQALLLRAVRGALARHAPGKAAILVSTLPIVPALFRTGPFRKKVYYCVDDFTNWAGIDGKAMLRLEAETLAACDTLIATSTPILESRGRGRPGAILLTHGVDVAHFSGGVRDARSPLAAFAAEGRRIVGIFGVFDRRIDNALFRAAAQALPEAVFAVVGPVMDQDPAAFADLGNIRFLGPRPYAELPGHVAWFDVCILPYVVDRTTHNINPLKLKEYLATGKPVIATPLPEAVKLGAYLELAEADAFPQAVARALQEPQPQRAGLAGFLAGESWEAKAGIFEAEVLKSL